MGDVPLSDLLAVATYSRLGVVAHQLGIDPFQFESSRIQLTPGVNEYARVWLDADARRLALRTTVPRPSTLTRPGTTYLELESNPTTGIPDGTLLVVEPRPLEEDLLLIADGKPNSNIDRLRDYIRLLGSSTVNVLGQGKLAGQPHWLPGVEVGPDSVGAVSTIAEAIGIAPYQGVMLGALHGDLAAHGCLVTLTCTRAAIRPLLTIEYRDLAWEQVVATASRLRSAKSGGGFGVLAGGFAAERAAYLEVTFHDEQVPRVRAAIEVVSNVPLAG